MRLVNRSIRDVHLSQMAQQMTETPLKTEKVRHRIQLVTDEDASLRRQDYVKRCLVRMFPQGRFRSAPYALSTKTTAVDDNADPLAGIWRREQPSEEEQLVNRLEEVTLTQRPSDDDDNDTQERNKETKRRCGRHHRNAGLRAASSLNEGREH